MKNFNYEELTLEGYTHDSSLELPEFIYNLITNYNRVFDTVDKEGKTQCCSKKHRSLGDIASICKSYYPSTDIFEVKEILLNFGEKLVGHYCGNINKRVYQLKSVSNETIFWHQSSPGFYDEFGEVINYRQNNLYVKYFNI